MGDLNIDRSLFLLLTFLEKSNYKGYDPYDTLNSWVPFHWLGKWGQVLAIQFQKRNPINIRPFLGVHKEYNPKAMGLFLHACSLLYHTKPEKDYKKKAIFFFEWLLNNTSSCYYGACWG